MRQKIITEAREWVKTPYKHQAACKGVGVDCVGLIRGVGFAAGVLPPRETEWKQFNAYGRKPNPNRMREGMHKFLVPIGDADRDVGDIAWIQWRKDLPMHLAILSYHVDRYTLIHSFSDFGFVVEHGLDAEWLNRIASWWRYPGLAEAES